LPFFAVQAITVKTSIKTSKKLKILDLIKLELLFIL